VFIENQSPEKRHGAVEDGDNYFTSEAPPIQQAPVTEQVHHANPCQSRERHDLETEHVSGPTLAGHDPAGLDLLEHGIVEAELDSDTDEGQDDPDAAEDESQHGISLFVDARNGITVTVRIARLTTHRTLTPVGVLLAHRILLPDPVAIVDGQVLHPGRELLHDVTVDGVDELMLADHEAGVLTHHPLNHPAQRALRASETGFLKPKATLILHGVLLGHGVVVNPHNT
jgi:hypothetical protein